MINFNYWFSSQPKRLHRKKRLDKKLRKQRAWLDLFDWRNATFTITIPDIHDANSEHSIASDT